MLLKFINSIISSLKRYKEKIIPKYQQTEQELVLTKFIETLLLDKDTIIQPVPIYDVYFIINNTKSILIKVSLKEVILVSKLELYRYIGCIEYNELLISKIDTFIYQFNDKFKERLAVEEVKSLNRFYNSL